MGQVKMANNKLNSVKHHFLDGLNGNALKT